MLPDSLCRWGNYCCGNEGESEEMESEEYNRKKGRKMKKEQEGKEKAY